MGWGKVGAVLGIGGAAGAGYSIYHFRSNEGYIPYASRNHLIVTPAHPGANGREVAYEPVYEGEGANRKLKTVMVDGQERVVVRLLDPNNPDRRTITELGGETETPSIFNKADFQNEQRLYHGIHEGEMTRIRSTGPWGRMARDAGISGREALDAVAGAPSAARVAAGARHIGAGGGPSAWNTIKPFLPFAGPIAGLVIAALGNFSIPTLLIGAGLAAGGIFADKIEKGMAEQAALRRGQQPGGGGQTQDQQPGGNGQTQDPQRSPETVADQHGIPRGGNLPVADTGGPGGGAPGGPLPGSQQQTGGPTPQL